MSASSMKRHLPRVLSSFRSSKRRIAAQFPQQVVVQQSEDCSYRESELPVEVPRCADDANNAEFDRTLDDRHTDDVLYEDEYPENATLIQTDANETEEKYNNNFKGRHDSFEDPGFGHNSNLQSETIGFSRRNPLYSSIRRFRQNYSKANDKMDKTDCTAFNMRQIEVLHEFRQQHMCPGAVAEGVQLPHDTFDVEELHSPLASSSMSCSMTASTSSPTKVNYILDELVSTEESYVRELESIIEYYVKPFEATENTNLIPTNLRGQSDVIFGNLRDLTDFHRRFVLTEFLKNSDSVADICHVLVNQRHRFLSKYRPYCQNKPLSESLRGGGTNANGDNHVTNGDQCKFFTECQRRAGHLLPLSAYLLKPIQRITKYQLLLKELLRSCPDNNRNDVQTALASMLDLLAQLNADMQQLHILGFAGDLKTLGPLRLQTECDVFSFKRKSRRLSNKPQKRHLFLFDGGVLFCKKRTQALQFAPEYYEHKLCIPMHSLGFAECSKSSPERFELWDDNKSDGYAIHTTDEKVRAKWIQRLARYTVLHAHERQGSLTGAEPTLTQSYNQRHSLQQQKSLDGYALNHSGFMLQQHQRPQSWTSEGSTFSSSGRSSTSTTEDNTTATENFVINSDANGNNPTSPTEKPTMLLGRRLSTSTTTSGTYSSDHENNPTIATLVSTPTAGHVTNIQIPSSKSLQNTQHADVDCLISSTDLHHTSSYQLSIGDNGRHGPSELIAK
ncbi:rhoGEF domain-containing protein [Ditylenchus destructor]|nr:rhoGEF domain-containing protein [Ditylenchus destructor]